MGVVDDGYDDTRDINGFYGDHGAEHQAVLALDIGISCGHDRHIGISYYDDYSTSM